MNFDYLRFLKGDHFNPYELFRFELKFLWWEILEAHFGFD